MNRLAQLAAIASLAALAACGGKGDDSLGDNIAEAYDNAADAVDAQADNATNEMGEKVLKDRADALRDEGKRKEEAIDDADLDASQTNQAALNAM